MPKSIQLRRDFLFFGSFFPVWLEHSRHLRNEWAEEVKAEAQVCRFCGFEFPHQGVLPTEEIIDKQSVRMLSTC
jgi:hypothetical protein